ncbi:MAG: nucleotidyltransferase domain-containing protein [Candidatus Aenigmatarchaeota archaeon]
MAREKEKKLNQEKEKANKNIEKDSKVEKAVGKSRVEIVKKFAAEILKKHGDVIRSIVLFGSTARGTAKKESDIDIFVIIDDTRHHITPTLKDRLEEDFDKIAKEISPQLSIQQPYLLTEFWALVREGHPIIFNFIREGVPVFDRDVFLPIKKLLEMGEIKPSREAVEKFMERGPKRISRVESAKMYMIAEDCYYAMLETAQAVLMFMGISPPRPSEAPSVLRKALSPKMLEDSYIKDLEDVIELRKKIEHHEIKSIPGEELDKWIEKAKEFVKKMQSLIAKIEIMKRISMIEKSYSIMSETIVTLLKALGKEPKPEEIGEAFKKDVIEPGLLPSHYLDVWNDLISMREAVEKGKLMDIPKQDIIEKREYVRKFIREVSKLLKTKIKEDSRLE